MKKKYIIKLLGSILILSIISVLIPATNSANFTISKSSVTLNEGKTQSITINGSSATGRIDITSSNSNVASVDTSSAWIENSSKTIVITGKSQGTATITISGELYNSETDDEKVYTKTINVTVNKVVENNTSQNTNTTKPSTNTSQNTSKPSTSTSTTSKPSTSTGGTSSSSGSSSSSSNSNKKPSNTTNKQNITIQNQAATTPATTEPQEVPEVINEEVVTEVIEENTETIDIQEENKEEEIEKVQADNVQQELAQKDTNPNRNFIIYSLVVLALVCIVVGIIVIKKIWKK